MDALFGPGGPPRSLLTQNIENISQIFNHSQQIQVRVDALFGPSGPLRPGDLDDRCIERLGEIGEAMAINFLDVFMQKRWGVRTPACLHVFFCGVWGGRWQSAHWIGRTHRGPTTFRVRQEESWGRGGWVCVGLGVDTCASPVAA